MAEQVNASCRCTNLNCKRHGRCDLCQAFHAQQKTLTRCKRLTLAKSGGKAGEDNGSSVLPQTKLKSQGGE